MIKINNFEELKIFIRNNELHKSDIEELLKITLKVWITSDSHKEDLLNKIEEFYNKYPDVQNRPLFLDI